MERTFDALVVGAGYAGAVCARQLAEPVSYTHLDVYKRQVHRKSAAVMPPMTPGTPRPKKEKAKWVLPGANSPCLSLIHI